MADNKAYISNINTKMANLVKSLDQSSYESFLVLTKELFKERLLRFGDNPDFEKMSIREKIYPGMYFYNLLITDMLTTKRWKYWGDILYTKDLSKDIPYINFNNYFSEDKEEVRKMLENCIKTPYTSGASAFTSFVRYLLYCLKPVSYYNGNTIEEKEKEAESLLYGISDNQLKHYYENFSLEAMLLYPGDYLGELAAQYLGNNGSAYFPTPDNVVDMMVRVLMSDCKDTKFEAVCDPCCGSSRMLLYASNYSLTLYGCDINQDIVHVSMVNGYLFIPWMVVSTPEIQELILKHESSPEFKEELFKIASNGQLSFY